MGGKQEAATERDGACGLLGLFDSFFNFQTSGVKNKGIRSTRDQKPLHYTLKIQSFSLLQDAVAQAPLGRYESQEFDAGGYKWKLALYPNGDHKNRKGWNHVSLYLISTEKAIISSTSEVYVTFNFLVYDHFEDKYLTIRDGEVRRFHIMKTEWGLPQLLPLRTFMDSSNGFLVDDSCVFGVEIFVMKNEGKGEVFSLIKEPENNIYTWNIQEFSKLDKEHYLSDAFQLEGYSWKLLLYPRGDRREKGKALSLYLQLDNDEEVLPGSVYAKFDMVLKKNVEPGFHRTIHCWFRRGDHKCLGYSNIISLECLMKPSKGFIVNDTLTVEVTISVISTLKNLWSKNPSKLTH